MIDAHCHLDLKDFDADRDEAVRRAEDAGVKAVIDCASDFASNNRILAIARQYPGYVFACAGMDPVHCIKEDRLSEAMEFIIANKEHIAAVGEIGIDYYWQKEEIKQKQNLQKLVELAVEVEKPVVIHARSGANAGAAEADVFSILRYAEPKGVMLHHFAGTEQQAKEAVERGWLVSFATHICYSDNKSLIKAVPLENMLVETDSPYLHPLRGGRNEPANVRYAIEEIAGTLGLAASDVEQATEKNAERFFGLARVQG
jgi:TatD DNase family protein